MISASGASAIGGKHSSDDALRPVHSRWIEQTRRFLGPAVEAGSDFWGRWPAVRYLADDFVRQLEWERALVEELRPFVDTAAAERLMHGGEEIARVRLELDQMGRRRGTAVEFAAGASALLEKLERWCADIELAAQRCTLP